MKRFWTILILLLGITTASQAAVVYLKDGSRVKGTIVSATARDIQLHTPDGMLSISNERIDRIDYADTDAAPPPRVRPVAVATSPAPLDLSTRPHYFALGMGAAFPLSRVDFQGTGGGTDRNGDAGILIGWQYLYHLSPRWAAGLTMDYMHRSRSASQNLLPASTTDVSGDSIFFLPTVKFLLATSGVTRPYISAGLGMNQTSTIIKGTPNIGYEWSDTSSFETRTLMDDDHWGLASTVRTGLDFHGPFDSTVVSLELGWTRAFNPSYDATSAGKDLGLESVSGTMDVLSVAFRYGWRF
jgi:hypothetical protein